MQDLGHQYIKDNEYDNTGFRKKARRFQSKYRAEILNVGYEYYGNRLKEEDGKKGFNFYNGFSVFEEVKKRYPEFNKGLYCDMLRSEHIPFNLFIPLKQNLIFCKEVFNEFLNNIIKSIDKIKIEYAPSPKTNYLKDNTSFNAYIEYTHIDNTKGIIGIEVKYTEHEYPLKRRSKEERFIKDRKSPYYITSEAANLYTLEALDFLITDRFRQVWRNQLLGESILIKDYDKFKHFISLTFFPSGNAHFVKVSKEYLGLLKENENKFYPVIFEKYFSILQKHCPDNNFQYWVNYLSARYIVKESYINYGQ